MNTKIQQKKAALPFILLACGLFAIGALLSGCADDSSPASHGHDLTVNGSGFTDHAGQTVTVAVEHEADGDMMGSSSDTVADDGTFSVMVDGALEEDEAFHVFFFADADGDGDCDTAEGDVVWDFDLHTVTGDETVAVTFADSISSDNCAIFAEAGTSHAR